MNLHDVFCLTILIAFIILFIYFLLFLRHYSNWYFYDYVNVLPYALITIHIWFQKYIFTSLYYFNLIIIWLLGDYNCHVLHKMKKDLTRPAWWLKSKNNILSIISIKYLNTINRTTHDTICQWCLINHSWILIFVITFYLLLTVSFRLSLNIKWAQTLKLIVFITYYKIFSAILKLIFELCVLTFLRLLIVQGIYQFKNSIRDPKYVKLILIR